jgi:hypothetical protein
VQWILVQTTQATTLQLLLSGQPYGLALTLGAGAVVRFAGSLLTNNETLALLTTVATNLSLEIVWVKDCHPEIVLDTAVVYAGATVGIAPINLVTGDAPTLTTVAAYLGIPQLTPAGYRGVYIILLAGTVVGTAPTLTFAFQFSPDNVTWFTVAVTSAAAITTGASRIIVVYPTAEGAFASDTAINLPLPLLWRINLVAGGTFTSIAIAKVNACYCL